jgi:type IV secretory pathway VirB2 component (pilin)
MNTAKTVALIITIICGLTLLYNIYDLSTGGWERRQEFVNEFMKGFNEGVKDGN